MTFKYPANNTVIQPVAISMNAREGSMDNLGRLRTSRHQNIYEADFEYGTQPMRWENYIVSPNVQITATGTTGNVISTSSATGLIQLGMPVSSAIAGIYPGSSVVAVNTTPGSNSITLSYAPSVAVSSGTITLGAASSVAQLPGSGGVRMRLSGANNDITIRQTRPYHRYQPGKTMVMSTAMNFGAAQVGQRQRVGFFDDGNGVFLEQADPVYTASTLSLSGNAIVGNNIITGLSSTANCYIGMPVSGPGINPSVSKVDPNGVIAIPYTTTVTQIVNSSAVAISAAVVSTTVGNTYSFTVQANPFGMYAVVRSDVQQTSVTAQGASGGLVTDTRMPLPTWNGDPATIASIDWTRIQMIWIEYSWYGAGMTRWGVVINGEWVVLHYVGYGNRGSYNSSNLVSSSSVPVYPSQQGPWSRTGNLPVRYEQRNVGATYIQNDMYHYGVSVIVEGGQDDQRGFTYSYGMAPATPRRNVPTATTRYPVLSIQGRQMGTIEMSGNGALNTINSTSTNSVIYFTTPNTTFDNVQTSTVAGTLVSGNSIIVITSGTTANVVVGQALTSNVTSGIPAGASVASVNSTAIIMSAVAGASGSAQVNSYTQNFFTGRHIYFPQQGGTANTGIAARITASNTSSITFGDVVTGKPIANTSSLAGTPFQIGLINRGQLLPKTLFISSDALCDVELITSTTASPILLTNANFVTMANLSTTNTVYGALTQASGMTSANGSLLTITGLGSNNSFAMRDVSANSISGGEVVFAFVAPAGGSGLQVIDLSYFFPLYNTVSGNLTDILTVAVTTPTGVTANVGVHLVAQEAMS